MNISDKIQAELTQIIELARQAPSVHNSQPWQVKAEADGLKVLLDERQHLPNSDPTGREGYISLGIFCSAITIAAAIRGLALKNIKLEGRMAELSFDEAKPDQRAERELQLLQQRVSDRSIYQPVEISQSMQAKIEQAANIKGLSVHLVSNPEDLEKIAGLTAQGIELALSSPQFRQELSHYLIIPRSTGPRRGISVFSLRIAKLLELFEPFLISHGLGLKAEVKTERRRWRSASAAVFITTPGDVAKDWFNAGRAYLSVALAIESLGLSQATSAATVEASTFHEDIEQLLGTDQRLQSALRIGRGSSKKIYSPRLNPEEIIIT